MMGKVDGRFHNEQRTISNPSICGLVRSAGGGRLVLNPADDVVGEEIRRGRLASAFASSSLISLAIAVIKAGFGGTGGGFFGLDGGETRERGLEVESVGVVGGEDE